ncbi:MAG: putative toxin-antitoxin system toxin component, PIN family [Calditrichaeota bacterium]|nr:MAG: putative toxin-antitoxin system toxin component, PIN family [Calditrichota bacterium]
MPKKNIRLVIDTNIWISFLIGKTLAGLDDAIISDKVTIVFSTELFDELTEVLQRPRFSKYFTAEVIQEFISLIHAKVEWIEVTSHFDECRDPKDNFLLDLCASGDADYLITGDMDLLVLNPFQSTEIISYRKFRTVLKKI